MKHRALKPPVPKAAPAARRPQHPSPPRSDTDAAGPRPISARQQATRAAGRLTGEDIIERVAPRRAKPAVPPPGTRPRVHRRDTETTHLRRRRAARTNRRRIDYLSVTLKYAIAVFVAEAIVVLLFSPRFYITKTVVEGNGTVPTSVLLQHLAIGARQNIIRFPKGQIQKAILASEPVIEAAEIHRTLPGTVRLVVHERLPWASLCLPGGVYYTIDRNLIPFRSSAKPEAGLARLNLAAFSNASVSGAPPVVLGKPLALPGLDIVNRWLTWASAHSFPIDSIQIAPDGKLCLNRRGNLQVQVGGSMDLEKKIRAFTSLLQSHPELRTGTDIAYLNLFAYDAPAIQMRAVATKNAAHSGVLSQAKLSDAPGSAVSSSVSAGAMSGQEGDPPSTGNPQ